MSHPRPVWQNFKCIVVTTGAWVTERQLRHPKALPSIGDNAHKPYLGSSPPKFQAVPMVNLLSSATLQPREESCEPWDLVSVKSVSRELPGTVYFLTLRSPLPPQEGRFPFLGRNSTTVAKVSLRVSLQVFCWLRGNGLDLQLVLANIPIGLFVVIYRFGDFCLKSKQGTENSI